MLFQVSMKEAQQWCKLNDIPYIEVSAKDGSSVNLGFETVVAKALEAEKQQENVNDFPDSFILTDENPKRLEKCTCN